MPDTTDDRAVVDAARDTARTLSDVVRFCPHCGAALGVHSFVQEYWTADRTVYHVWCEACGYVFDVQPTVRIMTHEPAH
jgi:uncharacterized Zn finger protein